jgi:hypothetical protein
MKVSSLPCLFVTRNHVIFSFYFSGSDDCSVPDFMKGFPV